MIYNSSSEINQLSQLSQFSQLRIQFHLFADMAISFEQNQPTWPQISIDLEDHQCFIHQHGLDPCCYHAI